MATKKSSAAGKTAKAQKLTAKEFIDGLMLFQSTVELEKMKRFYRDEDGSGNKFIGVRWGLVFKLAKEFAAMEPKEIEKLLESKFYECRMGAVSIMDFQVRDKKTTQERKKELFDLYINRHDRINNWDLVDRSAAYVVGSYLYDKPRTVLYKLAKSKDVWQRRTAIVATYYFIRQGDTKDTFRVAEALVNDKHDLIHKAVGSWIREAGKKDSRTLLSFLDEHGEKMPRVMLRYAVEKLDKKTQEKYLGRNKS